MASLTWWAWVWVSSASWWWTESLACCSPWGHKESDTTEWLNNNNLSPIKHLLMLHTLLWPSYQGNSISSKPDQEWSSLWTSSGNLLLCIMLHLHWFSLRAHSKISSLLMFMYLLLCPQIACAFFPVYLCVWPISTLPVTGAVLCCAKLLQSCLSMGFSRQEYLSGLPCPPPGDSPNPGIEPTSLTSPGGFFTTSTV